MISPIFLKHTTKVDMYPAFMYLYRPDTTTGAVDDEKRQLVQLDKSSKLRDVLLSFDKEVIYSFDKNDNGAACGRKRKEKKNLSS
jgi:hypothetical protein